MMDSLQGLVGLDRGYMGVSRIRTKKLLGLYWGPLILGNYHIKFRVKGFTVKLQYYEYIANKSDGVLSR